jgi:hypothetical protein
MAKEISRLMISCAACRHHTNIKRGDGTFTQTHWREKEKKKKVVQQQQQLKSSFLVQTIAPLVCCISAAGCCCSFTGR